MNEQLVQLVHHDMDIETSNTASREQLIKMITVVVNNWMQFDFQRLVQLLYRIDVSEHNLQHLLAQQQGNASAPLIAEAILSRYEQIIQTRRQHRQNIDEIPDDERW